MPTPEEIQALWRRYDALMRQGGDLTTAQKAKLAELRAALVLAGIIYDGPPLF
jgi:hypothetical protein